TWVRGVGSPVGESQQEAGQDSSEQPLAIVLSLKSLVRASGRAYNIRAAPPNGSRLSCGANAGGRKRPALRYRLAGARTYVSSESRPHQLQALVRQQRCIGVRDGPRARAG